VCLRVGSRHEVAFVPFPAKAPMFVIGAVSTLVTFTLPEHLDSGHVDFARQLAAKAWAYAVAVERRYRGLPSLPGVPVLYTLTAQTYQYVLARHLLPSFGNRAVADIREAHVRRWRGELLDSGTSVATVAKAYRLMKAILSTEVDDGIVQRNPCRVRGAGQDRSPERPVLSVGEVVALAKVMPERYRALVLLAAFGSLRWGELAALRRCDIDAEHGTIRVERSLTELAGGGRMFGPPKSAAGKRVVVVPAVIRPALAHHMATFTVSPPAALVFTSPTGAPLRDGNFRRRVWDPALTKAGLSDTHFHD
jgi:integrase